MTVDSYLARSLVFVLGFSIATYGLATAAGGIQFDLNWMSYFVNVGSLFFAGVFCIGRANSYLLLTLVAITLVTFLVVHLLDVFLPLSAYLRVNIFPFVSLLGLVMLMRRNQVTMTLNAIRRSSKPGLFVKLVRFIVKKELPTRETNMAMMMFTFSKLYLAIDLIYALSSVVYYNYLGLGFYELFSPYIASGEALNLPLARDYIVMLLDIGMCIALVTNAIHDGKRPDAIGIGSTATYDRYKLR